MGQYHLIYNKTKKEYFGGPSDCGAKLGEKVCDDTALVFLLILSNSNGRGRGDFYIFGKDYGRDKFNPTLKKFDKAVKAISGRWAGDEIVVQGDYAEKGDPGYIPEHTGEGPDPYKNISKEVNAALKALDDFEKYRDKHNF